MKTNISFKTDEEIAEMQAIKEKMIEKFHVDGKEYTVLKPHAVITTTDERALAIYVEMQSSLRQLKESLPNTEGDTLIEDTMEKAIVQRYSKIFRKGLGGIECVMHLSKTALQKEDGEEDKYQLVINLYPIKSEEEVDYNVVTLDFMNDEEEKITKPCMVLEVKDYEGNY